MEGKLEVLSKYLARDAFFIAEYRVLEETRQSDVAKKSELKFSIRNFAEEKLQARIPVVDVLFRAGNNSRVWTIVAGRKYEQRTSSSEMANR